MNRKTIPAEIGGLKKMSREDFLRFYTNRPMYEIADQVYDFFENIRKYNHAYDMLDSVYEEVVLELGTIGTMLDFMEDLQGSKRLTEYYLLIEKKIWNSISVLMKDYLFNELERIFRKARGLVKYAEEKPEYAPVLDRLIDSIDWLPDPDEIPLEDDGSIPLDDLLGVHQFVNESLEVVDNVINIAREEVEENFLPFIISTGVKLDNSMYRDIYDCMKLANLIDKDQVRSHDLSSSRYVRENFIKLRFKRLQSNQEQVDGNTNKG
jgi:hypothetical protein